MPVSEAEARAYLSSKGVSQFIDQAIMRMVEEKPEDPIYWLQGYAAKAKPRSNKAKSAPPGAVARPRAAEGPTWSQLATKLPAGRTEEDQVARAEMFNNIDLNGSGTITEAEAVEGLKSQLPLEGKDTIEKVMDKAFDLIYKLGKGNGELVTTEIAPDALTRPRFRLLVMYLKRYCELAAFFDEFDSDHDMMLSYEEFVKALVKVEEWGIKCNYPELAFRNLQPDSAGEVPFLNFADWIIGKELEKEPLLGSEEKQAGQVAQMKAVKAGRPMKSAAVSSFRRGRQGAIDWALIAERLPYGRSEAEQARRKELFSLIDMNGNGYLSLAEIDKGMRDIFKLEEIFDCKPAMMRAFQAAKDVSKDTKSKLGHDYVTKCEFRILLEYLRLYFELFVMFDRMDADNDRRLTEPEFLQAAEQLKKWGLKDSNLKAEFKKMDLNGGGIILFDEFCHWAIPLKLDVEDDDQ